MKRQSLESSLPLLAPRSHASVARYRHSNELQKADNNVIRNDPALFSESQAAPTHNTMRSRKPKSNSPFLLSSQSAERLKKQKSDASDTFAERSQLKETTTKTSDAMHREYLLSESDRIMEDWVGVYDEEKHQFTSYALFIESKLDHIQQSLISVVGRPHPLETAACCATLWKMPGLLSCYQTLLQKLAIIVQSAVYGTSIQSSSSLSPQRISSMPMKDLVRYFYGQSAYFHKVQTLQTQYETFRNLKDPLVVQNLPWRDLLTIVGSTPLESLIDAIISVLPTSKYSLLITLLDRKRLANQRLEGTRQKRPWKIFVARPYFTDDESIQKESAHLNFTTVQSRNESIDDDVEIPVNAEELPCLSCTQIARVISISAHTFSTSGREMLIHALVDILEIESFKDVFKVFEKHARKQTLEHLELSDSLYHLGMVVRQIPEVPEVLFQLYLAMYSIDQRIVRGKEAQIKSLFFGKLLSSVMDSFFLSDLARNLSHEHWVVLCREMELLHPKKTESVLKSNDIPLISDLYSDKQRENPQGEERHTTIDDPMLDTFDQLQNLVQEFLADKQVHSARLSQMIRLILIPKLSNEKNIQSVLKSCWDRLSTDTKLQQFRQLFASFGNESQFSKVTILQLLDSAFTTLDPNDKKKWLQEKKIVIDEPEDKEIVEAISDDDPYQLGKFTSKLMKITIDTKFKWTECILKHLIADKQYRVYEGKLLKLIRKIQKHAKSTNAKMNITAATHAIEEILIPFGNSDRQKISQRLAEKMTQMAISIPLELEADIRSQMPINVSERTEKDIVSENWSVDSLRTEAVESEENRVNTLIRKEDSVSENIDLIALREPHTKSERQNPINVRMTATIATQTIDSMNTTKNLPSDSNATHQETNNNENSHDTIHEVESAVSVPALSLRTILSHNTGKKKRIHKINQNAVPRAISNLVTSWQMNVDQLAQFSKKTITAVLRSISEAYGDFLTSERRKKSSVESSVRSKKMTFAKSVYQSFLHSYGLPGIADIHLLALSIAVENYRSQHLRVEFFAQFLFQERNTKEMDSYLEFLEFLVCGEITKSSTAISSLSQTTTQSSVASRQRHQRISIPDKEIWLVSIEKAIEAAEHCFKAMKKQSVEHFCEKIAFSAKTKAENGVNVDVLLQLVLQEWRDEQVRRNNHLRDAFHAGDVDGDGQLTSAEFSKIILSIDRDREIGDILLMYSDTLRQTASSSIDANTFLQVAREYDLDKVPWDEEVELHTISSSVEDLDATWALGGVRVFFLGTLDVLSNGLSPTHSLRTCKGAGCGCLKCIVDGFIGFQKMRVDAKVAQSISQDVIVSDELVWTRFWHLMRQLHEATNDRTDTLAENGGLVMEAEVPRSNTSRRNAVPNFLFPNVKCVSGALGKAHDVEMEIFDSERIRMQFSHLYVQKDR
ncbi:unnamed protein product [Albugo candida]|uniref:EF-hand domain-containing protein n=1 Tax=Albugo candida TaxID=65357 RepID=A0A024GFZ0_9STRA|nr:unnamed protein product [Albugo candida]|eukprot:CCI45623.1 unnamed protein product [Albugo candida]